MNKFLTAIFFLCIFILKDQHVWAQENTQHVFTLEQCLNYAYEHNQDLLVSQLEVKRSKASVGEFTSQGLPQVNASAALNKNLKLRTTFIPAQFFDPSAGPDDKIEVRFGTPYDGDIGLSVSQMIFDGSFFVGLKASRTYQELTSKEHIQNKIDITSTVSKAYYTVLVNQEALGQAQSNFNRLDSLLNETVIMNENGFAEKIDVNRTRVEFNNAKTTLQNSNRAYVISIELLKFQIGMPIEEDLKIAESLQDLKLDYEKELAMEANYNNRIEYDIIQTRQNLAQINLRNNQVKYLPTMDVYFSWGQNAGVASTGDLLKFGNSNYWFDYQMAGIRLNLPIFDGLKKSHIVQQNRIDLEELMYQSQKLKNSIKVETQETRNNLLNSINQFEDQKANMQLAEEVYSHTKIKYQEGVGSNLEVIEAANAYKQSQTNYFNALYDALITKVDYEKSLGILLSK